MSRVEEMRSLTESLARSHAERAPALATLRSVVQSALRDARQDVAADCTARTSAGLALRRRLAEGESLRRVAVTNGLAGFARARKAMATHQRQSLAATTAGRRATLRRSMREVRATRLASAAAQANELDRGRADLARRTRHLVLGLYRARRTTATAQRETRRQACTTLKNDTAGFLSATAAGRAASGRAQREALETGHTARQVEVAILHRNFHAARQALAENLLKFSQVWRQFAGVMRSRPAAVAPSPRPPRVVLPSFLLPSFREGELRQQPAGVEKTEAATAGEPFAEPPRMPLEEEVFRYLADRPDGVRVVELEGHFGTSRIQMVQVLNRLIEQNRVRRDEERRLYFAA